MEFVYKNISKKEEDFYKNYSSLQPIFDQIEQIPPFSSKTYYHFNPETISSYKYTYYNFSWDLTIDAQEHLKLLFNASQKSVHSDIDIVLS